MQPDLCRVFSADALDLPQKEKQDFEADELDPSVSNHYINSL